jgi:hypothetical protein
MSWLPLAILGVMLVIALAAGRSVTIERVPMQWDFKGRPTWYAAKLVALAFPVVLGAILVAIVSATAKAEGTYWAPLLAAAGVFAAQLLHLFLLRRWQAKGRAD